jgi:signal transduction histidine kinase
MKPSILVVDDVEANLIALEALLCDFDCELVRASSGNEALKQLLRREFALMVLDVQMPGMDGYEVAALARQNRDTRNVPILFLTATHHTEENVLKGYGAGGIDFMSKPLNATVLRAKVSGFLEMYLSKHKLTELLKAHEKISRDLQLANDALRHFTNAASHDLKAPLRAMSGLLTILLEDFGERLDEQGRDYLDRSIKASKRMDSLLDALLGYARLQRPVDHGRVDCNAIVSQVRSDLEERFAKTGATLEVGPLPTLRADKDRIYQLFLNLIGNAAKFSKPEERPLIRVTADERGREHWFSVSDNGIGIASEDCAGVFAAFRRLSSKYEGTGLGLAICQQIVEQHSGRIWCESQLGKGTTFNFVLPAEPPVTV